MSPNKRGPNLSKKVNLTYTLALHNKAPPSVTNRNAIAYPLPPLSALRNL